MFETERREPKMLLTCLFAFVIIMSNWCYNNTVRGYIIKDTLHWNVTVSVVINEMVY